MGFCASSGPRAARTQPDPGAGMAYSQVALDSGQQGLAFGNRSSGKIVWVNSKLLHPRDQRRAAQTHARGGPVGTPDAPFAFGQHNNDLVMLLLRVIVIWALVL